YCFAKRPKRPSCTVMSPPPPSNVQVQSQAVSIPQCTCTDNRSSPRMIDDAVNLTNEEAPSIQAFRRYPSLYICVFSRFPPSRLQWPATRGREADPAIAQKGGLQPSEKPLRGKEFRYSGLAGRNGCAWRRVSL